MKTGLLNLFLIVPLVKIIGIAWSVPSITILLILSLCACGKGTQSSPVNHQGFEPYFQAFEVESIAHQRDVTGDDAIVIEFASIHSNEAGECNISFDNERVIQIDEMRWVKMEEGARQALIAHELGHCLLNRSHKAGTFEFREGLTYIPNAPSSLMNPVAADAVEFDANSRYYWDELFNEGRQ